LNYASNLAMVLPLPFRRGEGGGEESFRVVYPAVPSVRGFERKCFNSHFEAVGGDIHRQN